MMTESIHPPPAYHDFPQDDGWNVTLEANVKLHVYDKFYHLWRTGGYQNATDYVSHMLLLEEHNQTALRDLNESDPHKEDLTMELRRHLLDIAESVKQQESPSATSSNPTEHDDPSSPLQVCNSTGTSPLPSMDAVSPVPLMLDGHSLLESQVPPAVSYASLPQQSLTIPRIDTNPQQVASSTAEQSRLNNDPNLHDNSHLIQSMIQQVKMSDMPPLIPVSALVTPSHLDQGYLVPSEPSSRKSPHNPQLQAITDEDLAVIKPELNGHSHVPPNSPCGPNSMPMLMKLPGIGELCKRPISQMDNGFRTSPEHLVSPGGFQNSPLDSLSAPEVSSSCDSIPSGRPTRQKAEEARQFIHSICSPDSFDDPERMSQSLSLDDFDESDYSDDSEDDNNNSVKRRKISPTECDTCQEIFLSDEYLMQHYQENPGHQRHGVINKVFTCDLCSQQTEGKPAFMQHCREYHPDYYKKKVEKVCSICNVIQPNKYALRQHLRNHQPDLTLCPERGCGTVVKRQQIAQHMTKIHGESQVTCEECGKVFRNVLALKAHMQNVHKGFKYVCSYSGCHRSFKRPSTLKVHELIHKDFKPMKCKLCSFRCRQQASISHHFKQHHPGVKAGFVRQSEQQVREETMMTPTKNMYHHSELHSPVKHYMTPSPEMVASPDMISNGQYRMTLSSSQMRAEVC